MKENELYQLGNHRLLCGDSLQETSYKTLLQGNKIDLVVTDPPYNVDYAGKNEYLNKLDNGTRVQRDILNDVGIDSSFFTQLFKAWKPHLNVYNSVYIYIVGEHFR